VLEYLNFSAIAPPKLLLRIFHAVLGHIDLLKRIYEAGRVLAQAFLNTMTFIDKGVNASSKILPSPVPVLVITEAAKDVQQLAKLLWHHITGCWPRVSRETQQQKEIDWADVVKRATRRIEDGALW
jgi:hypothetical protein